MKINFKDIIVVLFTPFLFFIISCESFLDKKNYDTLNESLFFKTANDAEKAIAGAYEPFRRDGQYGQRLYHLNSVGSDLSWPGGVNDLREWDYFSDYVIKSDNSVLSSIWNDSWPSVFRANIVIEKVVNTEMDPRQKERILGEAHFIRALANFNLVRIFGKIPIITKVQKPSEMYVARNELGDVYRQIVSDLLYAENSLEDQYPADMVYKATRGTARAVLAQVYLTRGSMGISQQSPCWDSAVYWAGKIIESGRYSLWLDSDPVVGSEKYIKSGYDANFHTENGKESIFEIQYSDILGTDFSAIANPISERDACRPCEYSNWGRNTNWPKRKFYDDWKTWDSTDIRRDECILKDKDTLWLPGGNTFSGTDYYVHNASMVSVGTNITGYIVKKWQYGNTLGREASPQNMVVIRYAEVLLIMAEALNELGRTEEAYAYINEVRDRVHLKALSGLSQEEFRIAVLHERKYELAYEFSRWFDLTRTGKLIDAVREDRGAILTVNNLILPIPLSAFTINPKLLPQNEGY